MDVRKMRNEKLGARVVAALNSRNMEAYYVETKEEAVKKALELIPKGSSINMGGATSVKECGLYDAISNGEYEFYDRDKVKTPEEKEEIARKAFSSDYFLGSVNAMSEDGVFINIDGNANRVAAYAYGPKHVLLIVGMPSAFLQQDFRKRMPCTVRGMRRHRLMHSDLALTHHVPKTEAVLTVKVHSASAVRF